VSNSKSLFSKGMVLASLMVLSVLAWAGLVYGQSYQSNTPQAILLGSINIQPVNPIGNDPVKIQPGTPIMLNVTVENKGEAVSPSGTLLMRYALAKPLDKDPKSVVFETERQPLPSIQPGEKVNIAFTTPHQWPSVLDYIRHDWLMREYQAVASFDGQEKIIGTLAITFSAYYYPGIRKEFPTPIHGEINHHESEKGHLAPSVGSYHD
jgi:hypothetical protein